MRLVVRALQPGASTIGMSGLPDTRAVSISTAGYEDGLGRRSVRFDREVGGMLECLHLRPELWGFERDLRARAEAIASLEDERFVRVRSIEHGPRGLVVVSELLAGGRLADIVETRLRDDSAAFGIDAAIGFLLQALPALATLHTLSIAHGALAPGRILVTPASQIVLLDGLYAAALERLNLSRSAMWSNLGLLASPFAGAPRFDRQSDVVQAACCALVLAVGRPLGGSGATSALAPLVREVREVAEIRAGGAFAEGVHRFFSTVLPVGSRPPHLSADAGAAEVERLAEMIGEETCHGAFQHLTRLEPAPARIVRASDDEEDLGIEIEADELDQEAEATSEGAPEPLVIDRPVERATPDPIPTRTAPPPAFSPEPVHFVPPPTIAPTVPLPVPVQPAPVFAPPPATVVTVAPSTPAPATAPAVTPPSLPAASAPAVAFAPPPVAPVAAPPVAPVAFAPPPPPIIAPPAPIPPIAPMPSIGIAPAAAPPPVPAPVVASPTIGIVTAPPAAVRVRNDPPAGYTPARMAPEPPVRALPFVDRLANEAPKGFPWKLAAAALIVLAVGAVGGHTYLQGPPEKAPQAADPPRPVATADLAPTIGTTGGLAIDTQPTGAKIVLDGADAGVSPLKLENLTPGRHTIVVTTDQATVRRTVRVEAGRILTLDIPVYSGWVVVFSPIPLDIASAGTTLGNTDTGRIILPPGRHVLTLTNREYGFSDTRTVEILPGEERPLNIEPKGLVNVNAHPWAEVWIDGKKAGDTPIANLPVLLGTRTVVFKHPQYGERRITTTITSKPTALTVDLTKS